MKKILLFVLRCEAEDGEPLRFDFFENDEGTVIADFERYDGTPVFANLELVDLFGKKTHVPACIKEILKLPSISWAQLEKVEAFQRICSARVAWSFGCINAC
ncbi:MAG: hypothetical protein MJ212_04515 [Alphaproteobacteria bacterium]|nr:hypothetical protein [Alphaproteobacteria bacterium]